jgi:segregation and condensation protein A
VVQKRSNEFVDRLENEVFQHRFDFEAAPEREIEPDETLVVDLDGYEGPLHVLLDLARAQKVDLLKISITKLAEQYLSFIHEARKRRFGLAADYLVMAAWLAYLKSRLLLPKPERKSDEEPPPEDLASMLTFRLNKLEAMRKAVEALGARSQLGRDVFKRGDPEAVVIVPSRRIEASIYELMSAYVTQRRREVERHYDPTRRFEAFSLEAARDHLWDILPELRSWTAIEEVAPVGVGEGGPARSSYVASTLSASLELTKAGVLRLRQLGVYDTLYMRQFTPGEDDVPSNGIEEIA